MTDMTPERLAEIRARAEVATEGPWHHQPYGGQNQNGDYSGGNVFDRRGEYLVSEVGDHDGEFIAHARTDVPALVAEVEQRGADAESWERAARDETRVKDFRTQQVQRLTNDLAVTEAQAIDRDEAATILAQQVEKVRALHQPWDDGPQPYCTHDREPWPCPTEQALGAR